ncbi:hypothetical protein [Thalassotalea profundi]|uniref:Transglutaminase domain-containing protein n=1 Tax=Thalassotalea profundi TaxID=2036687 RepID=A0ABQ3IHC5_9GAMM|nr:hypothetical protein [Thalassotalea profundi]GHE81551.1 hypothetical protein GCM10011501_07230 [Thalassotalea profundi]
MKFNDILFISTFSILTIISKYSVAEQLSFHKSKRDDNYLFEYSWRDINHQKQSIEFLLPKKSLFTRFRTFKTYKKAMASEFVKLSLKKHLRDQPIDKVQIEFSDQSAELQIKVSGESNIEVNNAYQKIEKLQQEYMQTYLTDNYYHLFTMNNGIQGIKPDHTRIANESVDDLKTVKPVILEKVTVKNIRKVTNYILGFIQTIPYETLQSRATSSGSGFNTPLRLLWENKGDCDSKVTLTVALLRALMPRIKIALIFIDNHAIFGIDIPAENNETTLLFGGTTYVLADPTGPRLMNVGQLSNETKNIVLSGLYSIEVFE